MRILVLVVALAACGGGHDVDRLLGAKCTADRECDERCLGPNAEFPEGLCSLRCDDDRDCPSDARCVASNGGVCLYDCIDDRDCDFLGERWGCRTQALEDDRNTEVDVCLGR